MAALKILVIAQDHPDRTPGGSEIVAHDLARALDARPDTAARLMVASTALDRPEALAGALGARGRDLTLRTGAYDRFAMARLDGAGWLGALEAALAAARPDVVHLHGIDRIGAEIVPALKRMAPGRPVVMTLHDYGPICAAEGLLLTVPEGARCLGATPDGCRRCFPEIGAARHALRRAQLLAMLAPVDLFLAPSGFLRDRFVAWGIEPARIRVLPNAVKCAAAPEGKGPPRARRDRFAFFGNVARRKGVLTLLEAAARLRASGDGARVTIHGGLGWADDGFRDAFAAALAAAGPAAAWLGPYRRDEVVALMRRADWVVAPSTWWENAPLVIEEARRAGRPAIVSGIGGMAEMVADGEDGLHVPPGDAAALAETMRAAADDPKLWRRLAARCAPADHDAFVAAHVAIYAGLRPRAAA
jgi:glycosyltransferase involved in cell wall biosynthesis